VLKISSFGVELGEMKHLALSYSGLMLSNVQANLPVRLVFWELMWNCTHT